MSRKEVTLKLKKLDERAVIPTYAHDGDVGMDLTAIDVEYDKEKDMYPFSATDHDGRIYHFRYGVNLFPLNTV